VTPIGLRDPEHTKRDHPSGDRTHASGCWTVEHVFFKGVGPCWVPIPRWWVPCRSPTLPVSKVLDAPLQTISHPSPSVPNTTPTNDNRTGAHLIRADHREVLIHQHDGQDHSDNRLYLSDIITLLALLVMAYTGHGGRASLVTYFSSLDRPLYRGRVIAYPSYRLSVHPEHRQPHSSRHQPGVVIW
jgi:hypothetical protein